MESDTLYQNRTMEKQFIFYNNMFFSTLITRPEFGTPKSEQYFTTNDTPVFIHPYLEKAVLQHFHNLLHAGPAVAENGRQKRTRTGTRIEMQNCSSPFAGRPGENTGQNQNLCSSPCIKKASNSGSFRLVFSLAIRNFLQ